MNFAHLHVHTQYSILDGAARIKDLINKSIDYEMPGMALTDHGNMFGAIDFFETAKSISKERGVPFKAAIGSEVYVAPQGRFYRKGSNSETDSETKTAFHLVLIAKDFEGYKNLTKLVSLGYTEGFYYRPRIDYELLEKYNKGIIALSACLGGEIPYKLGIGADEDAIKATQFYKSIFGDDFYIELQDHKIPLQKEVNPKLFSLAKKENIKIVATNDVHYVNKDDYEAHEVLLAIQTKAKMTDPNRFRFPNNEFYLKSYDEMKEVFPKLNTAFSNTCEILDKCDLDPTTKKHFMPEYDIPKEYTDDKSYIHDLCMKGIKRLYGESPNEEVMKRFNEEFEIITSKGFQGYFLIVSDFIKYARDNDILVGPGRGSAAGSIIAYALGITLIDPLKYGLLFERFLNPDRSSLPDIDVDFPDDRREDVIKYVNEKYGADNVSQIITFNTLNCRSAVRDVCRVLDIDLSLSDSVAKLVPSDMKTLEDAYKNVAEFRNKIDSEPSLKKMFGIASKLTGLIRSAGLHAAGVVISSKPIMDIAPVYQDSRSGIKACQYEMNAIESSGLVKMDFLGIKNLRLIKNSLDEIKKVHGIDIDIDSIDVEDKNVYEKVFQSADTAGVFQFESDGIKQLLKNVKPTEFRHIVDAVALYRPGPLRSGFDATYANRKNGLEPVTYENPDLEDVLKDTYGVLIYQEQIMTISRKFGGFTMGEADGLRKAMGKKKVDLMKSLEAKFVEGGISKGYDERFLTSIYDQMSKFGEYGFNKSHSVCYALLAYQEAYLKTYYPMEYYIALFNTVLFDTDKINGYLNEVRTKGIKIVSPSVNESFGLFSQKDGNIVYGLQAIKGVGENATLEIERERSKNGEYKSIQDFAKRASVKFVNRKVYEFLIKSGAFNTLGENQATLIASLDKILSYASSVQKEQSVGQTSFFDTLSDNAGGSADLYLEKQHEYAKYILRQNEEETLGFMFAHHPISTAIKLIDYTKYNTILEVENFRVGMNFVAPCAATAKDTFTTKTNKNMHVITLSDLTGSRDFYFFEEQYKKYEQIFNESIEDDATIVIEGSVKKNRNPKRDNKIYQIDKVHIFDDILNGKAKVRYNVRKLDLVDNSKTLSDPSKTMNKGGNVQNTSGQVNNTSALTQNKASSSKNVNVSANLASPKEEIYISINIDKLDEKDDSFLNETLSHLEEGSSVRIKFILKNTNGEIERSFMSCKLYSDVPTNFEDIMKHMNSLIEVKRKVFHMS